jgi:single-strand DNA-binding protein
MIEAKVIGILGNDAEVKEISGAFVVNFSVAHSEKKKNGDYETTWVQCSLWSQNRPKVAEYLKKKTPVYVSGKPKANGYKSREGVIKSEIRLLVRDIELLPGLRNSDSEEIGNNNSANSKVSEGKPFPKTDPREMREEDWDNPSSNAA